MSKRSLLTTSCSLFFVSLLAACGSPDPTTPSDSNHTPAEDQGMVVADMSATQDLAMTPDASSMADMAVDASMADQGGRVDMPASLDQGADATMRDMSPEQDLAVPDAGDEADMVSVPDMSVELDMASQADMSGGDYADRAQGDCTKTSECGSADLYCERSAVGGTCTGPCAACDDIPSSQTYSCIAGACVPECSDDTDCPPGRTCNTRRGVCQVERCVNDVCPVPWFGCSAPDGICVRKPCDAGQACPAQTQCDGSYCIETHAIR